MDDWSEQEVALVEKRELKNFNGQQLSDHELLELIVDRVNGSPYLKSETIKISVSKGTVIVVGQVNSQADKIRLSELIESMPSVREIRNKTEVKTH